MDTIFDALEAKIISTAWDNKNKGRAAHIGEALFPHTKTHGLDLAYGRGKKGYAVALKPSQFDAKATVRGRIGFKKVETEMPFFREGMPMRERESMDLYMAAHAGNKTFYDAILSKIYDDRTDFVDGAFVQAERMRTQLLQYGTISITDNRVDYDYDYEFDPANTMALTGDARWDQLDTSDPASDMYTIQRIMRVKGKITRAIMSPLTLQKVMENEKLKRSMYPHHHEDALPTETDFRKFLYSKYGISIAVADDRFCLELNGPDFPYWEDGIVTFIPDGALGKTHFGTTPEELSLMSGNSRAKVAIVDKGVAIETYIEEHPVNHIMNVSAIMLPSFEQMDKVFILRAF